ncbi:MAG: hypothetical protein HS113_17490, partial [Verrucomicrobiales bacterium]|nr:hypothetical protein [Verrucomicrobiales bacterium]
HPRPGGGGGGIHIGVDRLVGAGGIVAAGGDSMIAAGGGGRVAVYAGELGGFDAARVTAPAGVRTPGYVAFSPGGAGTVFMYSGPSRTHARYTVPGQLPVFPTNNYVFPMPRVFNDSIAIHFNKTIATNSFSPDKLAIQGPVGPVLCSGVSEIGDRLYRFDFPPQSEQGSYHFTLLPTLLDAEGFMLDQDADGIPGEPEDAFNFTLVLDTVPPRIVRQDPAGDVAGTLNAVDIWFSERIDTNTLSAADFRLIGPATNAIPVTSINEVGLNRFRFAFAPQTALGHYILDMGPHLADLAGNVLDQDGDGIQGELEEDIYRGTVNLVEVDFELAGIASSTNEFWAGDAATVFWTGRNVTGAPLLGDWLDAVYLSPDPFWNVTDIPLATVPHSGGLASNEVYSASAHINVPGVLPGTYYLLVRADIGNQTRETVEANNVVVSDPIPVRVRDFPAGGGAAGFLTPTSRRQYFALNVPPGESLRLSLSAPSGVNHLFVNHASIPTRLNSDFQGVAPTRGQQLTLTGVPGGGTYYILVSGEQVSGSIPFELSAEMAPVFVTGITPAEIVSGRSERFWVASMEDAMPTATLTGIGFDRRTKVDFLGTSSGRTWIPEAVELVSPTSLALRIPASEWPSELYNVRVTKGGNVLVLTNVFRIIGDGEAKLEARIIGTALSPAGGQTLYVEYANVGTRSMPVPLLKVTAYINSTIRTHRVNWDAIPGRAPSQPAISSSGGGGGGGGPIRVGPRSYTFNVNIPLHTVQAMAVGSGTAPGWLLPGERGRLPIHFAGLHKDRGEGGVQFSVGSLTADDTTLVEWPDIAEGVPGYVHFPRHGLRSVPPFNMWTNGTERLFTVNWAELQTASRPETVAADAWHAVWSNVIAGSGPLWPDYLLMLGDNMNHLAKVGQMTNDPGALFNFEVLQSSGALSPVRTLAASVDASAPSPGFPLVFRRTYAQPILSRYRLGPLGRGWSHNWDVYIQTLTNSYGVTVRGPGGADRFFGQYSNGRYTAMPGDNATLIVTNRTFRLGEADGTTWVFATNAPIGPLQYVEDPNGNRITCGYTGALLTSLTHSRGRQFLLQYNAEGRLSRLTDPLGPGPDDDRVTTFSYVPFDFGARREYLTAVTTPDGRVTRYAYDAGTTGPRLHALQQITYPDGTGDSFSYDAQGRLIQTSQHCCGTAQQVTYAYDSAGTVTVTDATGRATQLLYGLGGQLAQVLDGEGRIVNFAYDGASRLRQLLGPGGERYRYAYDALGNLTAIEDPLRHTNTFAYHPDFNRLARVVDARGNGLRYDYDARGNLTAIIYADNSRELFAYDARGNVVTSTNRRGSVITYTYNPAGQLTSKDYADTPGITDFTYAYDPAGNLTAATSWNPESATQETVRLRYEPLTDRLSRIEYPGGQHFAFAYDAAGRRTLRTDQDGNVTAYLYDALGRLDQMTNGLGHVIVDYDYDPTGRLERKTLGNGVYTTYAYNAAGQVTALVNSPADHTVLSSFGYTYDTSGRRVSMSTLAGTETYAYDPLGQLTGVTYPDGRVVTYAYDAAGNRIRVTDRGVATPYAANRLNQYTTVGADTFGYDLDGNLTNKTESATATTYAYDPENRLIGVATPTDTWTYTYDAFGNRIAATHNGQTTRYVVDPTGLGNVAAEYDGGGSLIARYEHGFGLLARTDAAGNPAFYTFSAIGHTSELTGPYGAVANAYAYDPFGLSLAKTETIPNPFEFVGEFGVINGGNGLEFIRARDYAPSHARFFQLDPIGIAGGVNLYAYTGNSPISFVDRTGGSRYQDTWDRSKGDSGPAWDDLSPEWKQYAKEYYHYLDRLRNDWENKQLNHEWQAWRTMLYSKAAIVLGSAALQHLLLPEMLALLIHYAELSYYVSAPDMRVFLSQQLSAMLVRSSDPNDKLGPSGYGSAGYLPAGGAMAYQIRFENQPSATAPAQRVTVTDTLDPNLDLSTFEWTEIAFANQFLSIPSGLSHYQTRLAYIVTNQTLLPLGDTTGFSLGLWPTNSIMVEVDASLDVPTRKTTLSLSTVDPATGWWPENPLIGFLYPNTTNRIGEGSLSYLVRAKAGLPSGTRIENRARIVFDVNDPIDTPLVFNTIDADAPTSRITSATAGEDGQVTVTWATEDDSGGVGVAGIDLLASANGGDYFAWLTGLGPQQTSAVFQGASGVTYRFIIVARDHVGNEESRPATPDATVTIPVPPAVIDSVTVEADGRIRIRASGTSGFNFTIEASEDLVEWRQIGVIATTASGTLEFVDAEAPSLERRFYRWRGP